MRGAATRETSRTMPRFRAAVAGATCRDRCVRIAGTLAELAVTTVRLHAESAVADFVARRTDLPGEIERRVMGVDGGSAGGSVLVECPGLPLACEVSREAAWWVTDDPAAWAARIPGGWEAVPPA